MMSIKLWPGKPAGSLAAYVRAFAIRRISRSVNVSRNTVWKRNLLRDRALLLSAYPGFHGPALIGPGFRIHFSFFIFPFLSYFHPSNHLVYY